MPIEQETVNEQSKHRRLDGGVRTWAGSRGELHLMAFENMYLRVMFDSSGNVFSQFGEDEIIDNILNGVSSNHHLTNWCVEFGAWDGQFLSNTCNLIKSRGFHAVLIEGDSARASELAINFPQSDVYKINRFVRLSGSDTLDDILGETPIPKDFDVLSIDIDGCDYWVLDGLAKYEPKIIVVEFNPTIPNTVEFVQAPDPTVKQGSSAFSLCILARKKGYNLVAVTTCNLIFLRNEYLNSMKLSPETAPSLTSLRDDTDSLTYIFSGYDGRILLSKPLVLPWHLLTVEDSKLQVLPKFMREFSGDYGVFQRIWWKLTRMLFGSSEV